MSSKQLQVLVDEREILNLGAESFSSFFFFFFFFEFGLACTEPYPLWDKTFDYTFVRNYLGLAFLIAKVSPFLGISENN